MTPISSRGSQRASLTEKPMVMTPRRLLIMGGPLRGRKMEGTHRGVETCSFRRSLQRRVEKWDKSIVCLLKRREDAPFAEKTWLELQDEGKEGKRSGSPDCLRCSIKTQPQKDARCQTEVVEKRDPYHKESQGKSVHGE